MLVRVHVDATERLDPALPLATGRLAATLLRARGRLELLARRGVPRRSLQPHGSLDDSILIRVRSLSLLVARPSQEVQHLLPRRDEVHASLASVLAADQAGLLPILLQVVHV